MAWLKYSTVSREKMNAWMRPTKRSKDFQIAFGAHKGYGLALVCELLGGALAAGLTTHDHDNSKRRVRAVS